MYSIEQRREIASRIAKTYHIPTYRRLLRQVGSPYAGTINANERKLAVLLVSALLTTLSEGEIVRACERPAEVTENAQAANAAFPATAAVKKNARKSRNTRTSTGKTLTILLSAPRTLSSRMRSIWADGCATLKSACTRLRHLPNS